MKKNIRNSSLSRKKILKELEIAAKRAVRSIKQAILMLLYCQQLLLKYYELNTIFL